MTPPLSRSRIRPMLVLGILLLGAVLRFASITRGLPYAVKADEPDVMDRAVTMMKTGQFNPAPFFDYPALTLYLQAGVASVRFLYGAQAGRWSSLESVWAGDFYAWGRVFTATLSLLTILIVYRAAARWGETVAVVAALAVAVHPGLILEAQAAKTDTPMTFFVSLAFLLALCAAEEPRLIWFALGGAAAGLAGATKYNGLAAVMMPLAIVAALPRATLRVRAAAALAVVAAAVVAFLAAAPYTVLDLPAFLSGLGRLMHDVSRPVTNGRESAAWLYVKYLRNSFALIAGGAVRPFTAFPTLGLIGLGTIALIVQLRVRATRGLALALVIFPVFYFWIISSRSLVFGRYALPLVPMVCIVLAIGVQLARDIVTGPHASRRSRTLVLAAFLLVLVLPLLQAAGNDLEDPTRTAEHTGAWLVDHVHPGDRVVLESDAIHLPPTVASATSLRLINEPIERYREAGVTYLVVSSMYTDKYFQAPASHPAEVAAYTAIFRACDLVARFAEPGETTFTVLRLKPAPK